MVRGGLLGLALVLVGCAAANKDDAASSSASKTATPAPAARAPEPFGPPPPPPPTEPFRVLVGGDVIPHRPSLAEPSRVEAALAPLRPLFAQADAVVANYEAATGELDKRAFRLAYAAPPAWVAALPSAGIHAISVANNHACDLGTAGIDATLEAAERSRLVVLGGDAHEDPWAPRALVERSGKRVCAVAWTTLINAEGDCAKSTRLAVAGESALGRQRVASAIARARATCDATIAIVHGGIEYVPQTATMMSVARQAAESGADAVVLHHPHIASPVVVHATRDGRSVPIFASIGNLVSNQGESWKPPMFPVLRENRRLVCVNGWTRLGVLADLAFDFRASPKLDWKIHLLWTDNEHAENKAAVPKIATRLLDPDKDANIVARLSDDELGPVELFDEPCWDERPVYTDADRQVSERCSASLLRHSPPGTPLRASRGKKKR